LFLYFFFIKKKQDRDHFLFATLNFMKEKNFESNKGKTVEESYQPAL